MGKNKAEPLECSRLPYRFPALMIIIRELDPVATDVRPPRLRKTEAAAEAPTSYLGGSVTNSARRQFRGFPFLYFRRGSWRLFLFCPSSHPGGVRLAYAEEILKLGMGAAALLYRGLAKRHSRISLRRILHVYGCRKRKGGNANERFVPAVVFEGAVGAFCGFRFD